VADVEADLRELVAVKARYFRLLDTKQWEGLRESVFASDVVYEDDAKELTLSGATALLEFLSTRHARSVSVHQGFMPELEVDGDTARGIWAMEDVVRIPQEGRMLVQHGYGHYHEQYTRTADGWRISRMHLTRLWLHVGTETLVGAS
jgi:hypothetical protein